MEGACTVQERATAEINCVHGQVKSTWHFIPTTQICRSKIQVRFTRSRLLSWKRRTRLGPDATSQIRHSRNRRPLSRSCATAPCMRPGFDLLDAGQFKLRRSLPVNAFATLYSCRCTPTSRSTCPSSDPHGQQKQTRQSERPPHFDESTHRRNNTFVAPLP